MNVMRLLILELLFFGQLLLSLPSLAGGSFSGGEDSVVCFASEEIAKKAISSEGRLKSAYLDQITKIYSAEYWEGAAAENRFNKKIKFLRPGRNQSTEDFIHNMLRLRFVDQNRHLLFELIEHTKIKTVAKEDWQPVDAVPEIDDSIVSTAAAPQCRVLQIARWDRLQGGKYQVTFDKNLFEHPKFDALNKAIVQTHEIIYVLAGKLGHRRSEKVRAFVSFLFSDIPFDPTRSPDEYIAGAVMIHGLALYPSLLELLPAGTEDLGDLSRRKSYQQLIDQIEIWSSRNQKTMVDIVGNTDTALKFFRAMDKDLSLTDEIAFIWEAGRFGYFFDHLIDGRDSKVTNASGVTSDPFYEACFQPYFRYAGLFTLILHELSTKRVWTADKGVHEELYRLSRKPFDLQAKKSTCEVIKKISPFDALAERYYGLCQLRERAHRYCVRNGMIWN